jgi:hypothetical protein
VILPPDVVCFTKPTLNFVINLVSVTDNEMMHMVARRDGFYFGKARVLKPSRQDDMSEEAIVVQTIYSREYHSHLKSDSRSCGRGYNVVQLFNRRGKVSIELDGLR